MSKGILLLITAPVWAPLATIAVGVGMAGVVAAIVGAIGKVLK